MSESNNILDPSALLSSLPTLLPPSRSLLSPQDAIAALLHTIMSALGFRLIALDESSMSNLPSATIFPPEWNKNGPSHYTFKYRHEQSSLDFVLNVSKLGSRTLINAIAVESDKITVLDINTNDFVSPSFFPHHIDESNQPLVHGFISSNRVADLTSQIKLKIVQHLVPGLRKDGYTEQVTTAGAGPSNPPASVPARPNPQQPQDLYRPPPLFPPRNPLEIGRSDLDPFSVNPFSPPNVFPRGGDGMFVGPDHPIFSDRMRAPLGDHGPWGGDGFLPPMGAPPGARFDPVGPGPLFGRFPGRGRGGAGRFSGEPDNDELMPPGAGDMFM